MYLFGTLKGDYDRLLMPSGNLAGLYGSGSSAQPFEVRELYRLNGVNPMNNYDTRNLILSIHRNKTICKQTLEQTDIDNIIRTVRGEI